MLRSRLKKRGKGVARIIRRKKVPCFNLWLERKFDRGECDWNPHEHEDWELPPFQLFQEYVEKYPIDSKNGDFEVIPWERKTKKVR